MGRGSLSRFAGRGRNVGEPRGFFDKFDPGPVGTVSLKGVKVKWWDDEDAGVGTIATPNSKA